MAANLGHQSRSTQNLLQLAGADHRIDLRNVLLDFVAIAFHQAAGNDQLLRPAADLVLRHLQDRVHRLLLGRVDERAGVHDDDVGVFGARRDLGPTLREQAHHDLAVHQVLGTAQAHESYFLGSSSWLQGVRPVKQGYRIGFRRHAVFLFYHPVQAGHLIIEHETSSVRTQTDPLLRTAASHATMLYWKSGAGPAQRNLVNPARSGRKQR